MGDFFDGFLVILLLIVLFAAFGFVLSLSARASGRGIRLGATSNIIHPYKTFKEKNAEMGFFEKPSNEEMLKLKDVLEKQTIELDPKRAMDFINKGNAKSKLKDYWGAIREYNIAIELNPKNAGAYNNRGFAKNKVGDNEGAIQDYTKAIEIYPAPAAETYYNRGLAKYALGAKEGACLDWSKAGELGEMRAYDYIKKYCK